MSRRLRWVLALLVGMAMFAAACGNSDDDDSSSDVDASEDDTEEPADDTEEPADDTEEPADDTEEPADDTEEPADDTEEPTAGPDRDTFVALEGVPGVSDTEISVTVIGTQEGNPLGTCILDCYVTGIQSYFDYQNSLGGVFGRQLMIGDILDDELLQNQVRALEVVADDDALVAFNATLVATGWADLHDAGIPNFVWGIHAAEANGRDSVFGYTGVACATCTARAVPYMASLAGATTVAALGFGVSENSKVCAGTLKETLELYGSDIGVTKVILYDELDFGLPNGIGPQVSEWKRDGVDFVASCLDLNAMKTIAQELERQDYREQVTMYHPNTYNAEFVAEAGALFDGDYVATGFVPFEYEGGPAQATYDEWVAANGGPIAEQTILGWINADNFVQGLIGGGPEISRQGVVDAANTLTAFDAGGLVVPIDWTRQHIAPTPEDRLTNGYELECTALVQMQDGVFLTVSEPDKPWLCWDNADPAWSEPEPTSFLD